VWVKIISVNVNGIRASANKGLIAWLESEQADVVCIQETKAQVDQLDPAVHVPQGYHAAFCDAERKGYSGTAVFSKRKPDAVVNTLGMPEFDAEGRYLEARFGDVRVASLYLPSGSSGPERQASKDRFLAQFPAHLHKLRHKKGEVILCGDWNIAHKEIDLKNWKSNQKNSGFLPHERAWMDQLVGEWGWVDAFRQLCTDPDQYTWWSNRGQAWAKNVGWRIDYQIVTPGLATKVSRASIYKEERFSDHAPLIVEYEGIL
jgi:exodeoxyribonuclease-3